MDVRSSPIGEVKELIAIMLMLMELPRRVLCLLRIILGLVRLFSGATSVLTYIYDVSEIVMRKNLPCHER